MGKISGLSHVGVFVKDLKQMTEFYCDTLGLTESHRNGDRMVFLTADLEKEDHEVVLVNGRDGQGNRVLIAPRFGTVALWGLTSPGSLSIFTCYSQNSWESIGISTIR